MGSARESTRMQLVGSQQTISDGDVEGLQRFYGRLLDRLAKEVKHTGDVARHVGYRSALEGQHTLHFLGMEVNRIADIPPGLVAWSLGDGTWRTWEARAGRDVVISEQPIRWQWLDRKPSGHPRCTGEFATQYPTSTGSRDTSPQHDFWVSAHAYVKLQEMDASHDAVSLVDYDPSWPQQFEGMANWLGERLGSDVVLGVEHYGSTAIPGMPAKPIIDILVEIPSFAAARERTLPRLNDEPWEYWWYSDHMIWVKRNGLMGQRTHHVHLAPKGHPLWEGLAFRDHLRSHSDEAARYGALKRELAARYHADRERYTEAKTEFVLEVTSRALHVS